MNQRGWLWGWVVLVAVAAAGCSRPEPAQDQPAASTPTPPAATADTPPAQADPCGTATSQIELNLCKAAQAKTTDSLEGIQYAAATRWLKKRSAIDRLPLLEASEQAWKAYREGECKAEGAGFAGGSLEPTIIADCQARENRLRFELLQRVYADPVNP